MSEGSPARHSAPVRTKGNPLAFLIHIVSAAAGLLSAWSIASFVLYLYDFQHAPSFLEAISRGANLEPWPALASEIQMYLAHGYNLTWLNTHYLKIIRSMLYPFSQYLDFMALRAFGAMMILPQLFILCATAFCAGRVNHQRKRELFLNCSPTAIHILYQARFLVYSLFGLFMAFHLGGHFPMIGYIPIYTSLSFFGFNFFVWYSSPVLLLMILATPSFYICYQLASHFNREI